MSHELAYTLRSCTHYTNNLHTHCTVYAFQYIHTYMLKHKDTLACNTSNLHTLQSLYLDYCYSVLVKCRYIDTYWIK
jgi:hypothetical protein